jgi:hypothetical protein
MKKLTSLVLCIVLVPLCLMITNCGENYLTPSKTIGTRPSSNPGADLPEGIPESGNWNYPYPTIIKREYIPPNRFFVHTKCLAWRITWPAYNASADVNKIPTVFSPNGALNSFNYLNSVDPQNTLNSVFSLYYDDKVEVSAGLWAELDYADVGQMEITYFVLSNQPLGNIIDWVTERPSLFESYWPGGGDNDLNYSEGDFIQYKLGDDLYGGIRIVSMSPRIIEVYLAVPNN